MPKRGGRSRGAFGGPPKPGRFQNEHDDRGSDHTRRVSFKPHNKDRHGAKSRNVEMHIRTHLLEDEDIDMGGTSQVRFNNGRGTGYRNSRGTRRGGNGRNSPAPRGHYRKLVSSPQGWYIIVVPYGNKYTKEEIITAIRASISSNFKPLYYKNEAQQSIFYLENCQIAEEIQTNGRNATLPNGFKMNIKVRPGMPQITLDEKLRENMKKAMASRYNDTAKALDLSKFHADDLLTETYCSLSRITIFSAVVDVIAENIPELEAMNLDENGIFSTDPFKCLANKLPHIKILHLKNNKISQITSLDVLKGLPLQELVLEGNPMKKRIRDNNTFVSAVRKIFPKLIKLDGEVLPPKISFDVSDITELPQAQASFLCDAMGGDIVRQFLQQYFMLFDSDNRQPLLDAYHENAMLSLTTHSQKTADYSKHNRNLYRTRDSEARCRSLKRGRLPIVSFLSELPKTRHDPMSFAVDLSMFLPQMMLLTVSGIYEERESTAKYKPNRHFYRVLLIVPSGGGFCIKNEELVITNSTSAEDKAAFATPSPALNPTNNNAVTEQPQPQTSAMAVVPASTISDHTKHQMIQAISSQSKMNLQWSEKCLVETNWDFQHAMFTFTELQKQGKIPAEAFI